MGRIATGWSLTKASFGILRLDPEILAIPAMAFVALVALVGLESLAAAGAGILGPIVSETGAYNLPMLAFLYVAYVTVAFVGVFFNVAVIEEATLRFNGANPTVRDGLRKAWSKRGKILAWALIAATVGLLLRLLRERAGSLVGSIAAALAELAWGIATFFVVPVLVYRDVGPVDAIRASAQIVKSKWGESFVGVTATSLIFFLLGLLGLVPMFLGVAAGGALAVAGVAVAVVYWLLLAAANSAVRGILVAALYHYHETGRMPGGFDAAKPQAP